MEIREKAKKHWLIVVILLLTISNALLQEIGLFAGIEGKISTGFLITIFVLQFIKDYRKDTNDQKILQSVLKSETRTETIEQQLINYRKEIEETSAIRLEARENTNLLIELINHNVISVSQVVKLLPKENFISVAYASRRVMPPTAKSKEQKTRFRKLRTYHRVFKKLGFTQLRMGLYIISERYLYPEKFRNIRRVADYLINEAQISLNEEWNKVLEISKREFPMFFKRRTGKDNPLQLSILVSKISGTELVNRYVKENEFKELEKELASIAHLKRQNVDAETKIKIKDFVLNSSIDILLTGLPKKDKAMILTLETHFLRTIKDGGLGVVHFYDYSRLNTGDIVNILKKKFDESMAKEYAELIQRRSKQYEKTLQELGISIY